MEIEDLLFKSLQKDGTVDATEACGNGKPDLHLFFSRHIRNIVEVAIKERMVAELSEAIKNHRFKPEYLRGL